MKKQMKIYISGPITGCDLRSRKEFFEKVAETIRQQGHVPVNPLEGISDTAEQTEETHKQYMLRDLQMLLRCDAIVLLGGWSRSGGCLMEYAAAQRCGLSCYDYKKQKTVDYPARIGFIIL